VGLGKWDLGRSPVALDQNGFFLGINPQKIFVGWGLENGIWEGAP